MTAWASTSVPSPLAIDRKYKALQVSDLTALKAGKWFGADLVYVRAYAPGWAGSASPLGGHYRYRDGTTGTAGTSGANQITVYDADGIGWKLCNWNTPEYEIFGAVGDGVTDDRSACIDCHIWAAGRLVWGRPGAIYGLSRPLNFYSFGATSGGIACKTKWISHEESFSGDGSTVDFVTANPLYDVTVEVSDVEQLPDSMPFHTIAEITVDLVQRNDYHCIRDEQKIRFNTAPAAGTDNIKVFTRRPGVMFKSVGDWTGYSLTADKNRVIGLTNAMTDEPYMNGFTLINVGIDARAQSSTCIRGTNRNIDIDGLYLIGASGYAYQVTSYGGTLKNVLTDHVFPMRATAIQAGQSIGEDCWIAAGKAKQGGGTVGIDNNGMDFKHDNGLIENVRVRMFGNFCQSAFWQNGSNNTTYRNITVIDGKTGIGGEQIDDCHFNDCRSLLSGMGSPNNVLNSRMGFFRGSALLSDGIHLVNPFVVSDGVAAGIAYTVDCDGSIVGGQVKNAGDVGIQVHGSNKLSISSVDLSDTATPFQVTATLGTDIVLRGCLGLDDIKTETNPFEYVNNGDAAIGAGNVTSALATVAAGEIYECILNYEAAGQIHIVNVYGGNSGPIMTDVVAATGSGIWALSGDDIVIDNSAGGATANIDWVIYRKL